MIRKLLRRLTLVPFRKVLIVDVRGRIWRGRVYFCLADVFKPVVCLRMVHPMERAILASGGHACAAGEPCNHNGGVAIRNRSEEGLSWCRGWNGPAVDALRTVRALIDPEAAQQKMPLDIAAWVGGFLGS